MRSGWQSRLLVLKSVAWTGVGLFLILGRYSYAFVAFLVALCVVLIGVAMKFQMKSGFLAVEMGRFGYCVHCGYNLTGNLSGICPKCGERIWSANALVGHHHAEEAQDG